MMGIHLVSERDILMQYKRWLCLLLAIGTQNTSGAMASEESVLKELAESHPNCVLYKHFYVPANLIDVEPARPVDSDLDIEDEWYEGDFGVSHTKYRFPKLAK